MRLFGKSAGPTRLQITEEQTRLERGLLAHDIMDLDRKRIELASVALSEAVDETLEAIDRQEEMDHESRTP